MICSRAIILMNALRKWGVLPSDKMICEMDDKQFEKWYHQTSDRYIFENREVTNLICRYPKTLGMVYLITRSRF